MVCRTCLDPWNGEWADPRAWTREAYSRAGVAIIREVVAESTGIDVPYRGDGRTAPPAAVHPREDVTPTLHADTARKAADAVVELSRGGLVTTPGDGDHQETLTPNLEQTPWAQQILADPPRSPCRRSRQQRGHPYSSHAADRTLDVPE